MGLIAADNGLRGSEIRIGQNLFIANLEQYSEKAQKQFAQYGSQIYQQDNANILAAQREAANTSGSGVVVFNLDQNGATIDHDDIVYGPKPKQSPVRWNIGTGSEIKEVDGLWDYLTNIAKGQGTIGQRMDMAWQQVKWSWRGSESTQGAVQMAGGMLEFWGATQITVGTGGVAVPFYLHAVDSIITGARRMWDDQRYETLTYSGVQALTGSERAARLVDTAIPFGSGIVGFASMLNKADLLRSLASEPPKFGAYNSNGSYSSISYGTSYGTAETALPRISFSSPTLQTGVSGANLSDKLGVYGNVAPKGFLGGCSALQSNSPSLFGTAANAPIFAQNLNGVVRTEAEAIALANKYGVKIPEDVLIKFVPDEWLLNNVGAKAEYSQLGKGTGGNISWEDLMMTEGPHAGKIPVRFAKSLLTSDEAIVGHIGHEMFELNAFEAVGVMPRINFARQIADDPINCPNNWHAEAWNYSHKLMKLMREESNK